MAALKSFKQFLRIKKKAYTIYKTTLQILIDKLQFIINHHNKTIFDPEIIFRFRSNAGVDGIQ
jgi:hypothetical protein